MDENETPLCERYYNQVDNGNRFRITLDDDYVIDQVFIATNTGFKVLDGGALMIKTFLRNNEAIAKGISFGKYKHIASNFLR